MPRIRPLKGVILFALACAFLACTRPLPTAPDDGPLLVQTAEGITVTYFCGNTFKFTNGSPGVVTLQWRVHGVQESGEIVLPARLAEGVVSESYLTTRERGPLQVSREGRVLRTVPNGHAPTCEPPTSFPEEVPDSIPSWVFADSNLVREDSLVSGIFPRGVLVVSFDPASTIDARRALTASIGAEVIGGMRGVVTPGGRTSDRYFLRLRTDRSTSAMKAALATLLASPIVRNAGFDFQVSMLHRRAYDGLGWQVWNVQGFPSTQENWALELIRAPLAWGCSIGEDTTLVGVVDQGFSQVQDLVKNVSPLLAPQWSTVASPHGTFVASVLGARGNDSAGMTGVQWRAGLLLHEVRPGTSYAHEIVNGYEVVAVSGARVVNISWGIDWGRQFGRLPNSGFARDRAVRDDLAAYFEREVARVQNQGFAPLIVIAAGNDGIDAGWSGYPLAASGVFGDRVLVVGASTRGNAIAGFSNRGTLISVYAPGAGVYGLDELGFPYSGSGTSYAAPYVTGAAGLLFSHHPALTPQEARQLLMSGAIRRGVSIEGRYLLDAYESLRLGAQEPSTPLCGNRLWNEGTQVFASRGPAGRELIADLVTAPAGYIFPFHGGRKVVVQDADTWDSYVYELQGGSWTSLGEWDGEDGDIAGGGPSLFGLTHDRDSVAFISGALWIGRRYFNFDRKIAELPTEGTQSGSELCVRENKGFDGWNCVETSFFGTTVSSDWRSGAHPAGENAIYLKKRHRQSVSQRLGLVDCGGGPVTEISTCRKYLTSFTGTDLKSEVWRADRASGGLTLVLTLPGRYLVSITGSEDGGSIAVASEIWNGSGPVTDCRTDFYTLPIGTTPTPDASYQYGSVCFGLDWQGGFGATREQLTSVPEPSTNGFALQARMIQAGRR
jgi:subtilase family protein